MLVPLVIVLYTMFLIPWGFVVVDQKGTLIDFTALIVFSIFLW